MTYFSESHEYVRVEGEFGYVGISDYAQKQLGNIVYVDMPDVDDDVEVGEVFGAVESVKAASDLLSPVSGTVVEVNERLEDSPELINQDANENWIIRLSFPILRSLRASWTRILTTQKISKCIPFSHKHPMTSSTCLMSSELNR